MAWVVAEDGQRGGEFAASLAVQTPQQSDGCPGTVPLDAVAARWFGGVLVAAPPLVGDLAGRAIGGERAGDGDLAPTAWTRVVHLDVHRGHDRVGLLGGPVRPGEQGASQRDRQQNRP
nr:hypothetical protein [Actinomadura pelletieri]